MNNPQWSATGPGMVPMYQTVYPQQGFENSVNPSIHTHPSMSLENNMPEFGCLGPIHMNSNMGESPGMPATVVGQDNEKVEEQASTSLGLGGHEPQSKDKEEGEVSSCEDKDRESYKKKIEKVGQVLNKTLPQTQKKNNICYVC